MVEDPIKVMMENSTQVAIPNITSEKEKGLVPEVLSVCAVTKGRAREGTTEANKVSQAAEKLVVLFLQPCEQESAQSIGSIKKVNGQIEPKIYIELKQK